MINVFLLALLFCGQIYLYRALEPRLVAMAGHRRIRAVHYALLAFQFVVLAALSLDNNWPVYRPWGDAGPVGRTLSLAAGIWITGCSGAAVLLGARYLIGRVRSTRAAAAPGDASRRRFLATAAHAAAVLTPFGAAAYGALVVRSSFELRDIPFPVHKLPPDLDGLRIALLTDIHFGPYLGRAELDRVIDMANETRPHLTLVTGDLITRRGDPLDACLAQLAGVRAEAGAWGCLGNHETYARCENYTQREARRLGIEFLRQGSRLLRFGGAELNLVGVDYQSLQRPYLVGAGSFVRPGAVNLLMSHNPDVFPVAADLGYDLVVGGHTHGGQVTVEILEQTLNVCRFYTPFVAGLYRLGSSALYVSRGIGTINLPVRLGARPEVTLLRLTAA